MILRTSSARPLVLHSPPHCWEFRSSSQPSGGAPTHTRAEFASRGLSQRFLGYATAAHEAGLGNNNRYFMSMPSSARILPRTNSNLGCRPAIDWDMSWFPDLSEEVAREEGGDREGNGGDSFVNRRNPGEGGGFQGDSNLGDLYYQNLVQKYPGQPLFLRNYAFFLEEVKLDLLKAKEFYQRAILANPNDGEVLARYAKIIWEVHKDYDRASDYFERAIQTSPQESFVLAMYASFLWNSETAENFAEEG